MSTLSPQTIEALVKVISGGAGYGYETAPPLGIYRSGPKLESFMRSCGVMMTVGSSSRLPTLSQAIIAEVRNGDPRTLQKIIESAADPRDFFTEPEKLGQVIEYLNQYLRLDGLELRHQGSGVRLSELGKSAPVIAALAAAVKTFDLDTVQRDLDRAMDSATKDPEDAVTAACSIVEGVCRSVLIELGLPLPAKRDIQSLFRAVREPLKISADRQDFPAEIAEDVKMTLGGLSTVVQGIGSLRTHGGDVHGRERGFGRLDSRIARLAVHSAGCVALFIIETWQQKYPTKPLTAR